MKLPPAPNQASSDPDNERVNSAYSALKGEGAEPQEDALIAELAQLNARQAEIISQLQGAQKQEVAQDGAGAEDHIPA